MAHDLKKEFEFYIQNQESLFKQYPNKFLVIKDLEVKGAFELEPDAFSFAVKEFGLGMFIIHKAQDKTKEENPTYRGRVRFAS